MKKGLIFTLIIFSANATRGFAQEKVSCDSIYAFADNPAEYPGGMKGFYDYVKEFRYQDLGVDDPITGKFMIHFYLDSEGVAHDIRITPETDPGLALQKFMLKMQNWKPAKMKDEPVCIQMKIPVVVRFK